jgi:hypothetical protein
MSNQVKAQRQFVKYLAILCLSNADPAALRAQALLRPDSAHVETGNPLTLHFRVPQTVGRPVGPELDLSAWASQVPPSNLLKQTPWVRDSLFWTKSATILFFDADTLTLMPVTIALTNGQTALTDSLTLQVYASPSPDDLNDLAPIKDIHREEADWTDILPWLLGAALIGAFSWLAYKVLQRKRAEKVRFRSLGMPPHLLALQKLENLRQKNWAAQGMAKEHCAELSWILREYLEKRYGLPALESTTVEIAAGLQENEAFPAHWLPAVQQILTETDLAKFAQSVPSIEFQVQALDTVKRMVEETSASV